MKPTEQTCDRDRIDAYLDERMSESELVEFEDHLSHCHRCQDEIQLRAAEPEIWEDAVELLQHRTGSSIHPTEKPTQVGQSHHALSVLDSLTPTDDPEMLGRIGDYEICGVIGVGGMGAVLKGFDKPLRRVVAIKVMAPHLADSGPARMRFQREARAAAAITHDNVIDTYGVAEANGLPYLVMPFARGPSLQKRLDESGPLTAVEVVRIGRQIASGLAAAHEQGLVHRDIKPANILLNEGIERLWITDFGVARAMDDASMTQTGVIAGTPQYMSPEQARGESVDQRSDLFSLGSVLYTACTGHPPFRSEAAYGILRRITDTDPRPIRENNPEIPDWLCRIIGRLMAKHPADRYQSASEVAELLETCLAHMQQPTQVPLPQSIALSSPSATDWSLTGLDQEARKQPLKKSDAKLFDRRGVGFMIGLVLLAGICFSALQLTQPVDISGNWTGEGWKQISLESVQEASDWYTGSFTTADGQRGALQLEWSRLQRRYNGRWKIGGDMSGAVTLRAAGRELRGAISVDTDSPVAEEMPRLRELHWKRGGDRVESGKIAVSSDAASTRSYSIQSPIKGRIVRWGQGIREQSRVEKGDLIVELRNDDPAEMDRLKQEAEKSLQSIESGRITVDSREKELAVMRANVTALESRQRSYEKVAAQTAHSSKDAINSAKVQVETARSELAEFSILLDQAEAEVQRQQKLFDQRVISKRQLDQALQKRDQAQAKVASGKTLVQAAELKVESAENEAAAKQAKAAADFDDAIVQVNSAKAEQVRLESAIAQAKLSLAHTQRVLDQQQAKLARISTYRIMAPITGVITRLVSRDGLLKQGDVICEIRPAGNPNETAPNKDADPLRGASTSAETPSAFDALLSLSNRTEIANRSVNETLDEAMYLGERIRAIGKRLDDLKKKGQSDETMKQLSRDRESSRLRAEVAVMILKGELEAARKLLDYQQSLSAAIKAAVDAGGAPRTEQLPADEAVAMTAAEIRQFKELLEHYTKLQKKGTTREDDRKVLLEILKIQLEAARTRHQYAAEISTYARLMFEQGDSDVQKALQAEQAKSDAAAEIRRLEALLKYYDVLAPSELKLPAGLSSGGLAQPNTDRKREAILQVASARLDAAQAKLELARQNMARKEQLHKKGLISRAEYDSTRANLAEAEAAVEEMQAQVEYYRSVPAKE